MEKKLAEMLADCLEFMEREGGTAGQASDRFPEFREELNALLSTIQDVKENTNAAPSAEFMAAAPIRMKNLLRVRQQAAVEKPSVTFPQPSRLKHRNIQQKGLRRFSMSWLIGIVISLTLLLGGGGVAYASADALPGDGLYPVKTLVQDLELALTGDEGDIDLLMGFLNENIAEIKQLADQGRWDDLEEGLGQYQENLDALVRTRTRVSYLDTPTEDALNSRIQQELHTHSAELFQLQTRLLNKDQLQEKVQEAIQKTDQGQTYGPADGGNPEEPGSPNGAGPGEPQEPQGGQGNKNGKTEENGDPLKECRQNDEGIIYDENGNELLPLCEEQGNFEDGNGSGQGQGQGGKP